MELLETAPSSLRHLLRQQICYFPVRPGWYNHLWQDINFGVEFETLKPLVAIMGSYPEKTNMLQYLRTKSKVDCDSLDVPRWSSRQYLKSLLMEIGSGEGVGTLRGLDLQPG